MARIAAFLVLCCALGAADLKVDHATVAGRDLSALRAALRAAGIESVYGGPHTNHATEMALVSFPDGSYLELMGIQAQADPAAVRAHEWSPFLTGNGGPCAWALRVGDIAAEAARLKAAGVAVSAPQSSGRVRPDGVRLEWQTSSIGEGTRGEFFPFLIQDVTPRERRVYPQGKPVTKEFHGVARVVIAVKDMKEAIARYRQAFAMPDPIKQVDREFGAQLALMGGGTVILAAPLNADSWLAERIERFGEAPCAFLLAARDAGKWKGTSRSRWFGTEVRWLDVGWRLGVEAER
ncbi:MAG: VOC family protein [Acidobacteriota bacterium]|nr:VOC family protein [Acidobacteriota bacterium]